MIEKVELSLGQDNTFRVYKCLCHRLKDGNGGQLPIRVVIVDGDFNRVVIECPNCGRKTYEYPNLLDAVVEWECRIANEWLTRRCEFNETKKILQEGDE